MNRVFRCATILALLTATAVDAQRPAVKRDESRRFLLGIGGGGMKLWDGDGYGGAMITVGASWKRFLAQAHVLDVTFMPTPAIQALPGYTLTYAYGRQYCVSPTGSAANVNYCGGPGDLDIKYGVSAELSYALSTRRRPLAVGVAYRDGFEYGPYATLTWLSEQPSKNHVYLRTGYGRRWGNGMLGYVWTFKRIPH